ncbi:PREDICTED: leukocyte-associated immunoglobulin-like receptor 1 [Elephantulus edwardii]|uniref:leukocyte-associated immunoglobulin-like receptor 1 n=1 Tax=Elephantulus edwardii TaxID=28737 RepID=UPI0003F0D31D|nr:PREDICTED: leukocyte-associated immunoglobulin-like receptor 1 [Elephantulus edwardii]
MPLTPAILLGLGSLPRPSISAEPSSVVPWGTPVTFVCRGPPTDVTFRLEKDGQSTPFKDVKGKKSRSGMETEARFTIARWNRRTAGCYTCIYYKNSQYSERSDYLELKVSATEKADDPEFPTTDGYSSSDGLEGLPPTQMYILLGVLGACLLFLLILATFLLHRQCQRKRGIPSRQNKDQNQPESTSIDVVKSPQDPATVGRAPATNGKIDTSIPDAGGSQEVTYAQLNHQILNQRAAPSPLSTVPMAESITYAALVRR